MKSVESLIGVRSSMSCNDLPSFWLRPVSVFHLGSDEASEVVFFFVSCGEQGGSHC